MMMIAYPKKILFMVGVLLLSACSGLNLKPSLENDMRGKDLPARLAILENACAVHASNHHGRKEEIPGNDGSTRYKLSIVCHDMGVKILETNDTLPQQQRKVFSGLIAQCYEEGKHSQLSRDSHDRKNANMHRSGDKKNLLNDAEVICSLYQHEFDKAYGQREK